jgi:hypothetical protein
VYRRQKVFALKAANTVRIESGWPRRLVYTVSVVVGLQAVTIRPSLTSTHARRGRF